MLLTADGAELPRSCGTGLSKTAVWRWQERVMAKGIAGLLRDKTRPPRIALRTNVNETSPPRKFTLEGVR